MAIIKCPECLHDVSNQAVSCPHCGYPIADKMAEQKKSSKARVTIVAVSLVIVGLAAAASWWIFFNGDKDSEETLAYENIKRFEQENNVDSLSEFLNLYLDTYTSEAEHYSQVKDISDKFVAERDEWRSTKNQHSIESIHRFLDDYPVGYFHKAALSCLDSLQYVSAAYEDTKEAYEYYLTMFDDGKYIRNARIKIDSIDKANIERVRLKEEALKDSLIKDTVLSET